MLKSLLIALVAAGAAPAIAQHNQGRPGYRSVEEGIEDVSPLAKSGRIERVDLRHPIGFEQVYEITTPDGKTAYVRIDGGLVAVFKRSDYATGTGEALLPPGVVYHIGAPKVLSIEEARSKPVLAPNRRSTRISTRADNRADNKPRQSEPKPKRDAIRVMGPASIIENEPYRRLRITQLLRSAASDS